jgi:hypothetical protein
MTGKRKGYNFSGEKKALVTFKIEGLSTFFGGTGV